MVGGAQRTRRAVETQAPDIDRKLKNKHGVMHKWGLVPSHGNFQQETEFLSYGVGGHFQPEKTV